MNEDLIRKTLIRENGERTGKLGAVNGETLPSEGRGKEVCVEAS